jgi:hypothetical protein
MSTETPEAGAERGAIAADGPLAFGSHAGGERRWLVIMAIMTSIEVACWAICWTLGRAPAPFLGVHIMLAFAGLAMAVALRLARRRPPSEADWPSVVSGTLLVGIGASCFLPLKYAIPKIVPFWFDAPLAVAERRLFGGDPWEHLDQVIGWAAAPIDRLYGLWLPVQLLVLFTLMLEPPSRVKSRALIAYALAWVVLGVGAATIFSSAGPIFHDRLLGADAYAALPDVLRARGAWVVLAESDQMWRSFSTGRPGLVAGMSAVPSMHVAISFWIVLTARAMSSRLTTLAALYAIVISVGSVQLGWHYVSDGVAGVLGMAAVWRLAGALEQHVGPRNGRSRGKTTAPA